MFGKERVFCDEYIIDFNITRAAKAAGYTEYSAPKCGKVLLQKPHVIAYINAKLDQIATKTNLTKETIVKELWVNHKLARVQGNLSASNTSLGLIGKHFGMFLPDEDDQVSIGSFIQAIGKHLKTIDIAEEVQDAEIVEDNAT